MNIFQPITKRTKGIFFGWWILTSFNALNFYANGTLYYGFTAFFSPIASEMGWSRAAVATGASLFRMESGEAFAPLIGYLFNKVGARRLMMIGASVTGLGFIALSQMQTLWHYYAAFTLLALGFSFTFSIVMVPVLANWFHKKRGLAFGLLAGGNATGGLMVPLLPLLISQYGWRSTLLVIGLMAWVYCLPLTLVVRQRPEDMGLRPDGDAQDTAKQAVANDNTRPGGLRVITERTSTVAQAVRHRSFWFIAAAFTIWAMVINSITVHVIPFFTDQGFPPTTAALAVTALTLTSILSRIGFGRLADTFDSRYLLIACNLSAAAGLAVMAFVQGPLLIPLFVLSSFIAYGGAIPLRPQLLAVYYGPKALPMLHGVLLMVTTLGSTIGPVYAGWVYDTTGSYTIAWVTMSLLSLFGIPFILLARPPQQAPPAQPKTGLAPAP
ncbi:MAG: MFS transporter [Dehalococcoidia bacterium]|nr:MFS transporter [Dehalococcoidia bacterium]